MSLNQQGELKKIENYYYCFNFEQQLRKNIYIYNKQWNYNTPLLYYHKPIWNNFPFSLQVCDENNVYPADFNSPEEISKFSVRAKFYLYIYIEN